MADTDALRDARQFIPGNVHTASCPSPVCVCVALAVGACQ